MRGGLVGRVGSNPGMVEMKAKGGIEGHQLRAAGEVKRRGVVSMPPPLAGIRRGGQRRQRGPRSSSR